MADQKQEHDRQLGYADLCYIIQRNRLGKRLTNYTEDDVGGITDAFRLAQAAGISCAV
jgi:hypothetical protein